MRSTRRAGALVLLALLTPHPVTAQSLEEAAAREAARRRQAKGGGRNYTNKDLPKASPLPKGEEVTAVPVAPPENESPTDSARTDERARPAEPKAPPSKTEAEWREAADTARKAIAAAKSRLKLAEARSAGAEQALSTATVLAHKGKPEALLVVLEESKEAAQEVAEAKTALETAEAALERLAAEASAQGVPDSWWADPKSS